MKIGNIIDWFLIIGTGIFFPMMYLDNYIYQNENSQSLLSNIFSTLFLPLSISLSLAMMAAIIFRLIYIFSKDTNLYDNQSTINKIRNFVSYLIVCGAIFVITAPFILWYFLEFLAAFN